MNPPDDAIIEPIGRIDYFDVCHPSEGAILWITYDIAFVGHTSLDNRHEQQEDAGKPKGLWRFECHREVEQECHRNQHRESGGRLDKESACRKQPGPKNYCPRDDQPWHTRSPRPCHRRIPEQKPGLPGTSGHPHESESNPASTRYHGRHAIDGFASPLRLRSFGACPDTSANRGRPSSHIRGKADEKDGSRHNPSAAGGRRRSAHYAKGTSFAIRSSERPKSLAR